jgi:transposase
VLLRESYRDDKGRYKALDWLLERQVRIENGLARRHLKDGMLVLYDVTSSYFEGRCCPLAPYGHSRDHRNDRPQIVYGLLCTREGLPVAVEVFDAIRAALDAERAGCEGQGSLCD